MAKRRGFFAELNHQAQLAEKKRAQQARANARAQATALRQYEQARKAADRSARTAASASEAQRKAAEKEAAALQVESRQAEAASMNADLAQTYGEIDTILAATLEVDDYIDLNALRIGRVEHPAFDGGEHAVRLAPPREPHYPPRPFWQEPPAPTGLGAALGGRRRHAEAIAQARLQFEAALADAQRHANALHFQYEQDCAAHQRAEQARLQALDERRHRYEQECVEREQHAAETNAQVDRLINDLAFDIPWAIQEYISIVLSNSVYPEVFPVEHDFRFDLATRELNLTARVPEPPQIPTVKEYKYVKAKDEITTTRLSATDQKARYAGAVWQVAIRTLHEIFEADRVGRIHTISLTVDTTTIDPATGQPTVIPLVIVGAARESFSTFDLANVVPEATLDHLGAARSKNPFALTPADTSRGVRGRAR